MYRNEDILEIKDIQKQYFLLTWKMTGWCNYHCPYCINSSYRTDYNNWKPEEEILKLAERLNYLLRYNNVTLPIKLKLIGGEVTFYNLCSVLDKFDRLDKLLITTNFSNSLNYYQTLYSYCNSRGIELILILSKHEQNKDFTSKVVELTNWCKESNFKTPQVSFVVTPEFDFSQLNYYEQNGISNIKLIVEKLEDNSMAKLSEEQNKLLVNYTNKYNKSKNPTYKVLFKDGHEESFSNVYQFLNQLDCGGFLRNNYFCNAGSNMVTLGYDNNLWLNKCFKLKDCCLGSVWNDITFNDKPILCTLNKDDKDLYCNLCSTITVKKNV